MKQVGFFHILRFLHLVTTKMNLLRQVKIDILWKMTAIFDKLSDLYSIYYSLTEHHPF